MPPLNQIAYSVTDLKRTHRWYREVFGFVASGSTRLFRGPVCSWIQGLPKAGSTCAWLVDQHEFFQLEMFEFDHPKAHLRSPEWRPCNIGYNTVSIYVRDFKDAIKRAKDHGTPTLTAPQGNLGDRRVCLKDPEGVLLELMESDPLANDSASAVRPEIPVAVRSVTASVPDLDRSRAFFVDSLGLEEVAGVELHGTEHEALWGLAGAQRDVLLLRAGDRFLELVQYRDPVGRPWPPGYRISDQGLLNLAFGFRSSASFNDVYRRVRSDGYRGNSPALRLGAGSVVYVNDDQGFSVELLHTQPWFDPFLGFKPRKARHVDRAR